MQQLFLDAETTGLSEYKHDIIQLACIPIINGVKQKPFNEFCQPTNWATVQQEALDVHGITIEQMKTFQTQEQMLEKFINYANSFNTKFVIAGYNVSFDKKFMSAMFSKHDKSSDFFRLFKINVHDTYVRAKSVKSKIDSKSLKLEALSDLYGIEIKAHDALSDIEATIELDAIISGLIGEDNTQYKPSVLVDSINISSDLPEMPQLHVHSQYNMVDGIPLPNDWYKWAAENNVPGIAVADQGSGISLYNAIRNKEDTTAVPAVGLNIESPPELALDDKSIFNINAWAISNEGYNNLVRLSSLGFDKGKDINGITCPILTIEQVKQHSDGLVFGTADINGPIGQAVQAGDKILAHDRFKYIQAELPEIYIEFNPIDILQIFDSKIGFRGIKPNDLVTEGNLGKALNNVQFDIMKKCNAKAIPSTGACFVDSEDKIIQDCLSKNAHSDGMFYDEEYIIKKSDRVFKELRVHLGNRLNENIFKEWIDNAMSIVNRAKSIDIKLDYYLPKIEIPEHIRSKTDDYDTQTYLYMIEKIKEHGRWSDDPVYVQRFKKEIDVIMKNKVMNFIPYFLMYEDVSAHSREVGFLQSIGRGSAGGCLISYYLKIIHVDPVKSNLPFERFLSHARIAAGSWPDIDMDISSTARPHIMKYLKDKYQAGFAQVCTFSTMKTKNAIKDSMSAIYQRNRNDFEIKQLCDTIPDSPQGVEERDFLYGYTDKEGIEHEGEYERNAMLRDFFSRYPDVKGLVDKLLGTVRGWSRHASAFAISTVDLTDGIVPTLQMYDKGMNENISVTQYNAEMVEDSGIVKADVLGINTMSMVTDCVNLLKDKVNYLEEDDKGMAAIYRLPEDEGVYADFYNKDVDSSFQFNTPVVKGAVQEFVPAQRSHLSVMAALMRPGAMDAEIEEGVSAAQWYMDVRQGKREAKYIHPDLKPILGETLGIIVYQEQVMQILVDFCGYTMEETDQIRSAIAKKKHDVMMAAFDRIREATAKRGWTEEQSDALCDTIQAFSKYGFNRSHAHAYSELGYITMYLKHHHPLEWWASVLNNEKSEDKTRQFISLLGDTIRPASMKKPSNRYEVENDYIVAPISAIKRVGPASVNELVKKGPFDSLEDFMKRIDHRKVNKGVIEALVKARVADSMYDKSIVTYADRKLDFLNRYKDLKGGKVAWKPDVLESNPMKVFFMEKELNKVFNKNLLTEPDVVSDITMRWPALQPTGKKGIPYMLNDVPIIANNKIAEGLMKSEHKQAIGMILLFKSSRIKKGTSKRTGRPYCFLSIEMTDGYTDIEVTQWNATSPLRYQENSVIYIKGTLKPGFKTNVGINAIEIERIK